MKIALAGSPNSGKTALFNRLTGGRSKVGNYAGVTVDKKEGQLRAVHGQGEITIIDLPGTYSLNARSQDEQIASAVLLGKMGDDDNIQGTVVVCDATNLERSLYLAFELRSRSVPYVIALNMMDLARKRGFQLDVAKFSELMGAPVVLASAKSGEGIDELAGIMKTIPSLKRVPESPNSSTEAIYEEIDQILRACQKAPLAMDLRTRKVDAILLHKLWGSLVLVIVLALMFQAVFAWAKIPMEGISSSFDAFGKWVGVHMGNGPLRDLMVDGVIAGVGAIMVFLPQILILFLFILLLEDSGYMARAAFLMDQVMSKVGLSGKAFIPLLSSHACAIPGIMAARTIENRKDRLTTIMVAPLTTCSARLPVYALLIAAFIPHETVFGFMNLQGVVLFALYVLGIFTALGIAWVFKQTKLKSDKPALVMELPGYKWPRAQDVLLGLWDRARIFLKRAGTVILSLSILIWVLSTYPKPPEAYDKPAIEYSIAGRFGRFIEPAIKPIGFDWRIGIALVPAFAAREVMVSALGTVYSVEATSEDSAKLSETLAKNWSFATAISLLIWVALSQQCISTIAVVRRETGSWGWAGFQLFYMCALAYLACFLTYHYCRFMGWG